MLCFYYLFSFITQPSVFLSFLLLLLLWRCFVQLYNEFVPGGLLTCFHRFFDWEKIAIITVNVNDKWHTHALSQQNENIWCSSCSLCCSTNPSSKLYMRRVLYIDAKVEPRIKHAHSVSIVEVSFIYHNNNLSNGMKKKKKLHNDTHDLRFDSKRLSVILKRLVSLCGKLVWVGEFVWLHVTIYENKFD